MIELSQWAATSPFGRGPQRWLMLGKGPTFSRFETADTSGYLRLTLNHVIERVDADIAHLVDLDVLEDCAERILVGARFLVMPRYPHVATGPQSLALEELFDRYPVLAELDRQDRLVWYNLQFGPPQPGAPVLTLASFASEPALQIVGRLGAKEVRTLGVDGGMHYSTQFAANEKTRLVNGVQSFDQQFQYLSTIAAEHDIDFGPLVAPLRIFIGADDNEVVAGRVLEHSIRSHTTWPVEVTYLNNLDLPTPRDPANRGGTKFSFTRFAIPSLCGFRGRALYLDSDMQVFGDIAELVELPFEGKSVLCTHQTQIPSFSYGFTAGRQLSVMLLDCEQLHWDAPAIVRGLDEGKYSYQELMHDLCIVDGADIGETIPEGWNHLERFVPGETKLLHFTNAPTQPWRSRENVLRELWMAEYRDAVRAGAVPPEEVEAGVASGHLLYELTAVLPQAPTRRSSVSNALTDARAADARTKAAERELRAVKAELEELRAEHGRILESESYRLARRLAAARAAVARILPARRSP